MTVDPGLGEYGKNGPVSCEIRGVGTRMIAGGLPVAPGTGSTSSGTRSTGSGQPVHTFFCKEICSTEHFASQSMSLMPWRRRPTLHGKAVILLDEYSCIAIYLYVYIAECLYSSMGICAYSLLSICLYVYVANCVYAYMSI